MYIGHAWAALQCGKLSSTLCSDSSSNYYRRNLIMHDAKRKGTKSNRRGESEVRKTIKGKVCFQSCAIKVACTRSKFSGLSYKCLDLIIRCSKRV